MKNHIITKSDMDYEASTRIAAQHGRGKNKSLDVVVNPAKKRVWYVLKNNKEQVYAGPDIDDAITFYNAL